MYADDAGCGVGWYVAGFHPVGATIGATIEAGMLNAAAACCAAASRALWASILISLCSSTLAWNAWLAASSRAREATAGCAAAAADDGPIPDDGADDDDDDGAADDDDECLDDGADDGADDDAECLGIEDDGAADADDGAECLGIEDAGADDDGGVWPWDGGGSGGPGLGGGNVGPIIVDGGETDIGSDLDVAFDCALEWLMVPFAVMLWSDTSLARCVAILCWSAPRSRDSSLSSNLVSWGVLRSCVAILSGSAILSVGCVMVSYTNSS